MNTKENLLTELDNIHHLMLTPEDQKMIHIHSDKPSFRNSAINLVDYLALRSQNIELHQKKPA